MYSMQLYLWLPWKSNSAHPTLYDDRQTDLKAESKCRNTKFNLDLDFFVVLLLVSHLRLGQRKDDPVVGWLKPFYCYYTLPAFQLCTQFVFNFKKTLFFSSFFHHKLMVGTPFITIITSFTNLTHFFHHKRIKELTW